MTLKDFEGMSQSGRGRFGTLKMGGRLGSVDVHLALNIGKLQLLKLYCTQGHLACSVSRVCDSESQGCEFGPHVGHGAY